jgi:hypothetical protein
MQEITLIKNGNDLFVRFPDTHSNIKVSKFVSANGVYSSLTFSHKGTVRTCSCAPNNRSK